MGKRKRDARRRRGRGRNKTSNAQRKLDFLEQHGMEIHQVY